MEGRAIYQLLSLTPNFKLQALLKREPQTLVYISQDGSGSLDPMDNQSYTIMRLTRYLTKVGSFAWFLWDALPPLSLPKRIPDQCLKFKVSKINK